MAHLTVVILGGLKWPEGHLICRGGASALPLPSTSDLSVIAMSCVHLRHGAGACHPADRTRPVLRYAGNSGQSAVSRGGQASETAAPAKRG